MTKMFAVPGWRAWVALVVGSTAAVAAASSAGAEETAPAAPVAAAWYPTGIGLLTAPIHPSGSLHVGAAAGQETDRTYLRFDVGSLPGGAEVDGVTLAIPVDPEAGTAAPETAIVLACRVPGGFDADAADPAEVDCDGAPRATYAGGVLSVDVDATGTTLDVALVPGGGDTWHLAFDGPEGEAPPTAVARYEVARPSPTTTAPSEVASPPSLSSPRPTPALPPVPPVPLPLSPGRVIAEEAETAAPPLITPAPAVGRTGFRYAAVFGLPLALLVVLGLAGDGLTRPVRLREETP